MSSIVLGGRSYRYGAYIFIKSPLSSPGFGISRAASLNSAIGRGLRKSKGVGFRGKERSQERNDSSTNEERRPSNGLVRRTAEPPSLPKGQLSYDSWRKESTPLRHERREESRSSSSTPGLRRENLTTRDVQNHSYEGSGYDRKESSQTSFSLRLRRGKKDIAETDKAPKRRSRAGRFNDPEYSFGKRALERRAVRPDKVGVQGEEWDPLTKKVRSSTDSGVTEGRRRPTMTSAARRAAESDRMALERNPSGSKLSKGRQAYLTRVAESSQRRISEENGIQPSSESTEGKQGYTRRDRDWSPASIDGNRESRHSRDNDSNRSTSPRMVNDRLPLSVPYTTPASEFLYGTSVVEAALRSRREPRRKLYKLYVYQGEDRESSDGRDAIERLAKSNGVPIIHHTESPRLLDKMSAGRPHNGYILEASPLPKLPLISLGPLNAGYPHGFTVNLDYQSREEVAINGTSNFIPHPHHHKGQARNPLILFLDSILDPGNLGGIIRTASFLGVTAIALATRNSAPISPIVLKASAGASESVTLFSVNKPAGFITDSKSAGWKVYAAVAPRAPSAPVPSYSARRSTAPVISSPYNSTPTMTTSDLLLSNPLSYSPCILMLGNEGEGLRWNLRSKADVELSIAGGAQRGSGGVDSLNVSVAAGVLCQAFLSGVGNARSSADRKVERREMEEEEEEHEEEEEDDDDDGGWKDARRDERRGRDIGDDEKALRGEGDLF